MSVTPKTESTVQTHLDPKVKGLILLKIAGTAVLATFPVWSYFLIPEFGLSSVACALIVAAFVRILHEPGAFTAITTMMTALLGIVAAITQSVTVLKFWPVALIGIILLALAIGLGKDDGFVTRSVAKGKDRITDNIRAYSRSLSILWIVLFIALGSVAVLTCFWGNMKSWAFWNGGVAWMVGLAFCGSERLARSFFLRQK